MGFGHAHVFAVSILKGIPALVDDWLKVGPIGKAPHYRHKRAALKLSGRPVSTERTNEFVRATFDRIDVNWIECPDRYLLFS